MGFTRACPDRCDKNVQAMFRCPRIVLLMVPAAVIVAAEAEAKRGEMVARGWGGRVSGLPRW